jgi:hypothetical protein
MTHENAVVACSRRHVTRSSSAAMARFSAP